jgi:TPR repeat protein
MLLEGEGLSKDQAAAYDWFVRAAQREDAEAQNMVGRCLENGWGVVADASQAAAWFSRAADKGHAWARYNLGHLYLDGVGVAQDLDIAFTLYRRAAEAGHVRAMNLLARCYEQGWGVVADAAQAQAWYRRSAEGGYFRGQYNFATLLIGDEQIDEAIVWLERALNGAPQSSRLVMARQSAKNLNPKVRSIARHLLAQIDPKAQGAVL